MIVWIGAQGDRPGHHAGGRSDGLHHLHHADHHGLPDDHHDLDHAAARRCGRRTNRRGAGRPSRPSGIREQLSDREDSAEGVVRVPRRVASVIPAAEGNVLERHRLYRPSRARPPPSSAAPAAANPRWCNLIPRFYDVTERQHHHGRGGHPRYQPAQAAQSAWLCAPEGRPLSRRPSNPTCKFGGEDITDEAMEQAAEIAQAAGLHRARRRRAITALSPRAAPTFRAGRSSGCPSPGPLPRIPEIYIFDDSFSALDYKTDVALRRALARR